MTTIALPYTVPINTPSHITTNTSFDPTETFKTVVNNIIESIPLLTAPMSYELKNSVPQSGGTHAETKDFCLHLPICRSPSKQIPSPFIFCSD